MTVHERRQLGAYVLIVVAVVVGFFAVNREIGTIRDQGHALRLTKVSVAALEVEAADLAQVNRLGTRGSCQRINRLQGALIALIDQTVSRSERSAKARLASPTASPAEKAAARTNLATVTVERNQARKAFTPEDCSKIPSPSPPRT